MPPKQAPKKSPSRSKSPKKLETNNPQTDLLTHNEVNFEWILECLTNNLIDFLSVKGGMETNGCDFGSI